MRALGKRSNSTTLCRPRLGPPPLWNGCCVSRLTLSGGRQGRRADRGRHGAAQAGQTLGRGQAPALRRAGQAGELPRIGLAHFGANAGASTKKEVPVPIALRLYLPKDWAQDKARRAESKVPESISFETKDDIALAQIDSALADSVRFGMVLADAGYGSSAEFRAGLTQRGLRWAVGVQPT